MKNNKFILFKILFFSLLAALFASINCIYIYESINIKQDRNIRLSYGKDFFDVEISDRDNSYYCTSSSNTNLDLNVCVYGESSIQIVLTDNKTKEVITRSIALQSALHNNNGYYLRDHYDLQHTSSEN